MGVVSAAGSCHDGRMATPLDELTEIGPLWRWGDPAGPPKSPGAYAWFSDVVPASVTDGGLFEREGLTLLYVGIAPRASTAGGRDPHRTSLEPRIAYHVTGSAEASALRTTLGCVLAEPLRLTLELADDGERFTWGPDGEARVSAWIQQHMRVSWVVHSRPWEVSDMAFRSLFLPLNLNITDPNPFHRWLEQLKQSMEATALERADRSAGSR